MSSTQYASALEAEAAFYEAFEKADIDEMMAVWADDVDVVCVHPMGPRLEGRDAIRAKLATTSSRVGRACVSRSPTAASRTAALCRYTS